MRTIARLFVLFVLVALSALFAPAAPAAQATRSSGLATPGGNQFQFTASGHVLSFEPIGVHIASGSGLLHLEFAGTAGVSPTATTLRSGNGGAPPLEPVTYPELWNGISATFQPVAGGVLKSTYVLAPAAQVADIHLRYNVPVEIDEVGSLILRLPTGAYQESAPVAWQEIAGERISVEVAFQPLAEREIGFRLGRYNPAYPLVIDPTLQWNTFLGSAAGYDGGTGIAVDASGNVYVVGDSCATWGSPKRPFNTGDYDAFVAKLSSGGAVLWNTFLGGSGQDTSIGIALDSSGNIYVVGYSNASWGNAPKRPIAGSAGDAFVAKLDNSGTFQWNTFLGSDFGDAPTSIATDASGNVYASGYSYSSWGTVNPEPYHASLDGFVAKLNGSGDLLWNSFIGGVGTDSAGGVAVDAGGNAFVIGTSNPSWGSPREPFHGTTSQDAYVAKLNSSGVLQWNTFLGSSQSDAGASIALDANGGIYTIGISSASWGDSPRRPYSALSDVFVAKLDGSGVLQWNTFLGGASGTDYAAAISLDASGNPYIAGQSDNTWGSPIRPFSGDAGTDDVPITKLDTNGYLLWNTFLGSADPDYGKGIAVNGSGIIYVTGESASTWGSPLEPFHGTSYADAFVAAIRKENTTTALIAHTPSPSLPGQAITISYTVAANPPGSLIPTGSVTVSDGAVSCTDTLAVGHCHLTFTTAGTKNLTATYAGDTEFSGSSSAATGHQVNKASTTTSITGHTPNPSLVGQAYTVTWTVSVTASGVGAPTGNVTVNDGSGGTCTGAVSIGRCELVSTSPGTKVLTATYPGDSRVIGSSGTATHEAKNPEVKNNEYQIYLPLLRR